MSILEREAMLIQNPALGASILWRFISGYQESNESKKCPPIPLLFIVLAVIYHTETLDVIASTNKPSGLRMFVDKFYVSKTSKTDVLLNIHNRSIEFKELTTESIRMGLSTNLFTLSISEGTAVPLSRSAPKSGIPESVKMMFKAAEKLGFWCSNLTLHEISIILKVAF